MFVVSWYEALRSKAREFLQVPGTVHSIPMENMSQSSNRASLLWVASFSELENQRLGRERVTIWWVKGSPGGCCRDQVCCDESGSSEAGETFAPAPAL